MSSKKIWIGRVILAIVIVTIVAMLVYLFTSNKQPIQSNTNTIAKQQKSISEDDATKIVKSIYSTYMKTAYNEEKPSPESALQAFKKSVTAEGQKAFEVVSKGKDPVLCTGEKPEVLNYTEPTTVKDTVLITVITSMKEGTAQAIVAVDRGEGKIVTVTCQ